jgi:hypothetical protein
VAVTMAVVGSEDVFTRASWWWWSFWASVCGGFGTYTFRLGVVVALVVGAFGEEGMASRGRWGE